MERLYAELSEYYVFDKLKYTLEEFFGDIKTFKDQFKQVHRTLGNMSLLMGPSYQTLIQSGLRFNVERERVRGEVSSSTRGKGEG